MKMKEEIHRNSSRLVPESGQSLEIAENGGKNCRNSPNPLAFFGEKGYDYYNGVDWYFVFSKKQNKGSPSPLYTVISFIPEDINGNKEF